MYVLTGRQMKNVDRRAMETYGIPGVELMEKAALGVFFQLKKKPGWRYKEYMVFCGGGNNGGDGYEVARLLRLIWCKVSVIALCETEKLSGDARLMAQRLAQSGCKVISFYSWDKEAQKDWSNTVIVDALLGTGFSGELRPPFDTVIGWINEKKKAGAYVASVDIPSGLSSDTGEIPGLAVAADLTVTFCCEKLVHRLSPARNLCGHVAVADIGIPLAAVAAEGSKIRTFDEEEAGKTIPVLKREAHKGTSGRLFVLGGSLGMAGAAVMNAEAALRSGCGLVSVMVPSDIYVPVASQITEGMVLPGSATPDGRLCEENIPAILERGEKADALLFGSGMGNCDDTRSILRALVKQSEKPLVIDADGINILSGHIDILELCTRPCVLTPHTGEMSRLCGISPAEVEKNRLEVASRFAKEHGCVVVLKGPATVTASPEGEIFLNTTGNPGMATGGSGDVLSGVIGAFLARGIAPYAAAAAAVYIHGLAGDLAAEALSQYGMIATDIVRYLPKALKFYDCLEC